MPRPPAPVDLSSVRSSHSLGSRIERALWGVVWTLLFRPSPRVLFGWRRMLLRAFGARIGAGARVYPSARVWLPRNLVLGDHARLAPFVDCYNVDTVTVGANTVVSQYVFLCAATHDETDPHFRLLTAPVTIGSAAWVAADVFVAPGVEIGDGAVVGVRSSVFKSIPPMSVAVGTPARVVRERTLLDAPHPDGAGRLPSHASE